MVALLLLACTAEKPEEGGVSGAWEEMPAPALLTRASLDLRGVRPTDAEIAQVEADPEAVETLIDEFLHDSRFPDRVADLYNEVFLTRSEAYYVNTETLDIDDPVAFLASVGEEPLRMVARVADEDLPWTELVTGDWTMADERLARVHPVDYPAGATGWQVVRYTDGRPRVGVLATNGLWWRYFSTDSNANRKRANTVARIFLCADYLTRPIEFDRNVNLLDNEAVLEAVKNSPGCVNCHVTLDPLASNFFGFFWYSYSSPAEISVYHKERESLWEAYTGVEPGYFGSPLYSMEEMGQALAADPRLVTCAVDRAFTLLLRRDPTLEDQDRLNAHREAFLDGGLTVRALFRSILSDPAYRAAGTDDPLAVPRKLAGVELLQSQVEDLTGFHWTYGGYDMLGTDAYGVRTLGGGVDGYTVTKPAATPNASMVLVQEALAELAADAALTAEAGRERADRRLFTEVGFDEDPASEVGRAAMVAQIQALHLRLFGNRVAAEGEEVAAGLALWDALYAVEGDPLAAWEGLLSALLRDPDFVLY